MFRERLTWSNIALFVSKETNVSNIESKRATVSALDFRRLSTFELSSQTLKNLIEDHRFSAFWLRSCVVSVLVSLISGMSGIAWHQYWTAFWSSDPTKKLASVGPRIVPVLHYRRERSIIIKNNLIGKQCLQVRYITLFLNFSCCELEECTVRGHFGLGSPTWERSGSTRVFSVPFF